MWNYTIFVKQSNIYSFTKNTLLTTSKSTSQGKEIILRGLRECLQNYPDDNSFSIHSKTIFRSTPNLSSTSGMMALYSDAQNTFPFLRSTHHGA